MEQVRELLGLIKGVKTNGGLVVASFIVGDRRYQGEVGDAVEGRCARAGCRAIRSVCLIQRVRVYDAL